jgi:hypothetical protein
MENSVNPGSSPDWFSGLLGRRIAPGELRRQIEEYETLGVIASARGGCAIIGCVIGLGNLLVGAFAMIYAFGAAETMGGWRALLSIAHYEAVLAFGILTLVIGILSLSLTVSARRGSPKALRAIACAWAAAALATGCMWLFLPQSAWEAVTGFLFLLFGWFVVSRFFTAALRVESERRRLAQS